MNFKNKGKWLQQITESSQKNEALNLDKLTDADAKQLIMYLNDFIKDKASKYYYIDKIEAILKKSYKAESAQKNETYTIQNVKTREDAEKIIKEKCKPKDFHFTHVGIAYDGKKNIAQYTPHSNQLVIFESAQKNEALDEHELKAWLKSEHSRALKNIKNMAANDSSSFFKGYATALHEVQRKLGL